ncbi:MAG: acetyl-CoA carboxylase biotin carboxyl carrier protein [Bacteroidetes bacterium]|nr:acetyl-CoA carboxylase biotin carboxyl carrier protein [Bacteroidota bacterium]MCH8524193.1 acetyl-CoA carboxylase biotin carboxyl carrier protein [Balneolales bacterium]
MDLKQIKSLLNLISESDVNEVYIEEGDFKIKIKKNSDTIQHVMPAAQAQYAPQPTVATVDLKSPQVQQLSESQQEAQPAKSSLNTEAIKSPIVGTFYSAPSPEDKPFVSVGDTIAKGDTLCIIEAMKIMNEINAEVSGKVVKVLVSNAQPVEYDQPLFEIEPA